MKRRLRLDARRTTARLEALKDLVASTLQSAEKGHDNQKRKKMKKLSNMLPVYLKEMLFDSKVNTGLITPIRRMVARFATIKSLHLKLSRDNLLLWSGFRRR